MRKLTIYMVLLALVAVTFMMVPTGEHVGASAEDEYLARISSGLSEELEASNGELVSVIIWANSGVSSILDDMIISGKVASYSEFSKFNCYHIMTTAEGAKEIARNQNIIRMEENYTLHLPEMNSVQASEEEKSNWGLDILNVSNVWDKGLDGEGITVGILDSGVDAEHPELKGKVDEFASFGLSGEIDEDVEPFDLYGHGTHCSGIICGETVGVAPKAHLYVGSVMPTGSGTFAQVIAGMNWILDPDSDPETDDGPSIVSMSLGGAADQDMVDIADVFERSGVLLIASIGNSGEGSSGTPGNIPSVLGVGAINENRFVADSSSGTIIDWQYYPYEKTVTKPDLSAPGVLVYSSLPGGKYARLSGTSMAAPHVAGVSALLKQYDNHISNISMRETLEQTAEDLGEPGRDTRYGEGIVDPTSAIEYLENARRVDIDITGELDDEPLILTIPDSRTYRIDGDTSIYITKGESSYIELDLFGYEDYEGTISPEQQMISLDLEKLPIKTFAGNMVSSNGNPVDGRITFKNTPLQIETDENGFFKAEVPVDTYEVEYWGMCCEPITVELEISTAEGTIELQETDILVVATQGITPSQYQNRRFDTYCYRALDESDISYCPINPEKESLSLEDLQKFDRVYWFGGPNEMSSEYSDMLSGYLDAGGKLMLSSSNILLYDGYKGYSNEEPSFLSDYFGVSYISQGAYTTSLVGMDDTQLGEGLLLSLSGGDGATNQIGFDAFDVNSKSGIRTSPFLYYLGPASLDDGDTVYAGASIESGKYAGVYLSFGFEVVNNKADRVELLHRIEDWFSDFGSADITFENENGTPVYSIASIKGVLDGIETCEDGHVMLSSLKAGEYTLDVSALGYKKQSFDIEIVPGETKRIRMTLFEPANINVSGTVVDADTGEPIQCSFKVAGKEVKEYTTDENGEFELNLPLFDYEVKFYKKRYLNMYIELTRDMVSSDEPMTIDMNRYSGRYGVVEQLHPTWGTSASMGGWFFQGLAQNYDRVFGDLGKPPMKMIIPPGGNVSLEDINQFGTIIWTTGYNNEIGDDDWSEIVAEYVRGGGKLIFIGNTAPIGLSRNKDLASLLGFELVDDNSWIFTIEGVKNDPIGDGVLIAKYHPYTRNGLLTNQPSMKPINGGVSCFDLVGGESAGVWVKNDNQATVVLGFDMFDIYDDMDTHATILNRALELIEQ